MLVRQSANFNVTILNSKGHEATYSIWEPMAQGWDDPVECMGIGEGTPRTFIPPEAFAHLAALYLRSRGYFVVAPEFITLTPVPKRNGKGKDGSSPMPDVPKRS